MNDDRYIGLQAPILLLETIQTTIIIGSIPFLLTNLIDVETNGRALDSDSDPHTMNEFVGSSSFENDGYISQVPLKLLLFIKTYVWFELICVLSNFHDVGNVFKHSQ